MKIIFKIFLKFLKENLRNSIVLIFTILSPAAFLLLYYYLFNNIEEYKIIVIKDNLEKFENQYKILKTIIKQYKIIKIEEVKSESEAYRKVILKESTGILRFGDPIIIWEFDVSQINKIKINILIENILKLFQKDTNISYELNNLKKIKNRSEFENYVPGLLVFSILLSMLFSASLVVKEFENLNFIRYQLSNINAMEYFLSIVFYQITISLVSFYLSFQLAIFLGFHTQVSIYFFLIGAFFASLIMIFIGIIIASFAKAENEVLTYSLLPLFIFMWFSGALYPIAPIIIAGIDLKNFVPLSFAVDLMSILTLYGYEWDILLVCFKKLLVSSSILFVFSYFIFYYKRFKIN